MPEQEHRDPMAEAMMAALDETLQHGEPGNRFRDTGLTLDSQLESDLGLDSLGRAELLVNVECRFSVQLPEELLSDADTPRDILDAVARLRGEQPESAVGHSDTEGLEDSDEDREHFQVPDFETLQDSLQWHNRKHPGRTYLHWIRSYDDVAPLTFGELHSGALRVANGLFQHDLQQRDTVALMLPTGHDYFHGFFGALYANGIPVPLYPPARASQLEEHLRRQADILNNAQVRIMITLPEARKLASLIKGMVPSLRHVVTPKELWTHPLERPVGGSGAGDIAFLQYTSGSTGNPKGVQLTHANLFANIRAANEVLQVDEDDVFVSWLPLYHDMGLIGTCLSSLWYGMHLVIMSPLLFLARPRYWLWAIHQFGGTLSPAPNFGYELCLRRLDDRDLEGLDLGSWRVAFNGAEAVSPDTVERFIEHFKPYGFRPDAMAPVYGLAENCVALTFPAEPREPVIDEVDRDRFQEQGEARPAEAEAGNPLRFVSCGRPIPGHRIRIVDTGGEELPERQEGALQFTGPSATVGYFRNDEETARLFEGDWLNTGDRGYIADGELYLTGRNKDLIVRAGRNLYPGEIEETVGKLEDVRSGCVVAFATGMGERQGEKLVVVAETRSTDRDVHDRLKDDIARIARESLGIDVDDVVIVRPRSVPKTTSGKLRRHEARLRYERGELEQKPMPVWRQLANLAVGSWPQQARRLVTGMGRWLYSGWAWIALVLVSVPVVALVNILPRLRWRWRLCHRAARLLGLLTGTRLRVHGGERLKQLPEGCVMVANHCSYIDAFVMTALAPFPIAFLAKAELRRFTVLRRFMERIGVETIERASGEASVRGSRQIAERGRDRRLVFFAEGSFDAAPGLRPFHMGAFMTASLLQEPIIPIALGGTRAKLPADRWNPRPGPVEVIVGEAIEPTGEDWASAIRLRDTTRSRLLEMTGEPDRLAW